MPTKPLPGVTLDPLHRLSEGILGYWLFNEGAGSTVYDISKNKNHGTLTNMLPNTQGSKWTGTKFGGGLAFDGSNDFIPINNVNFGSRFTISIWAKPTLLHDYGDLMGRETYLTFISYADGHLTFNIGNGSSWGNAISTSPGSLVNGKWYNIVATYDGSQTELFLNAISKGAAGNSGYSLETSFYLGKRDRAATQYLWNGIIDNVLLFNRVLNALEIKQLYHNLFCNLMQVPVWQRYTIAGLSIPVAMHHYEMLRA